MRRDLHSNIKLVQLLANAAVTATQTSTALNMSGFSAAELVISIGTVANIANSPQPSWAFKLQESNDDSTYSDVVTAADVLVGSAKSPVAAPNSSTGVFLTVDAAAEDALTYRVGYIGSKKYVRVVGTAANTPGSTPLTILGILGLPALAPTAD